METSKLVAPVISRAILVFAVICLLLSKAAFGGEINPLSPPDTSSPRSTLFGFIDSMKNRFNPTFGPGGLLQRYIDSGKLFIDESEVQRATAEKRQAQERSLRYLDFSSVPEATRAETSWRVCIQLKETLDRMDLPAKTEVPDAEEMKNKGLKSWTIPGTEISIEYVEGGSRPPAYQFSRESVRQIPHLYELIRAFPYRTNETKGFYDLVFNRPTGLALFLHRVIPARWFFNFPQWSFTTLFDQPVWKWFFLTMTFCLFAGIYWGVVTYAKKGNRKSGSDDSPKALMPPLSLLAMIPPLEFWISEVLRVSPEIFEGVSLLLWAAFYLSLPWLVWILGGVVSSWVIRSERVNTEHVDAQLIRLGARLLSTVIGIAVVVEGANRLGLPAYSVIAGLGIGGLAIALAGQQALANLLGSLIIMFEKPFRVGQVIRTSGIEGKVEDIGFRSTRVRTRDNTLVIIPSAALVNSCIENLSLRRTWRIQRTFYLDSRAPIDVIRAVRNDIERLLLASEAINRDELKVTIDRVNMDAYELLVEFCVKVKEESDRLKITENLICDLATLAESKGVLLSKNAALLG